MGTPILMKKSRGEKTRTSDLHVPNVARCQLCYTPIDLAAAKLSIFCDPASVFSDFLIACPLFSPQNRPRLDLFANFAG